MTTESDCQKALEQCKVVLLDIAGTTTSLAFVKDTLFSYVVENVDSFLKQNWDTDDVKIALKHISDDKDVADIDSAVKLVKDSIEKQSDNSGLKTLNGFIYRKGYEDGSLKAHVYSDVPLAFAAWSKDRKIAIYSTGSIESQKLLFKHSVEGDLSSNIAQYFDQSVGLKTETESYLKIVKELNVSANEVLWISDLKEELKAAKKAGLLTILMNREPEDVTTEFLKITSFTELIADSSNKRKNEDDNHVSEDEPPSKISKKMVAEDTKKNSDKEVYEEVKDSCENKIDSDKVLEAVADIKPSSNGLSEVVDVTTAETKESKPEEPKKTEIIIEMEVESIETNVRSAETNTTICSKVDETVTEKMETDEKEMRTDLETLVRTETLLESIKPVDSDINEKTENFKPIETDTVKDTVKRDDSQVAGKSTTTATEKVQISEKITQEPSKIVDTNNEVSAKSAIQIEKDTDIIKDKIDPPNNVEEVVIPEIKMDAKDTSNIATVALSKTDTISITKIDTISVAENSTPKCDNSKELEILKNLEKKDSIAQDSAVNEESAAPNKCEKDKNIVQDSELNTMQVQAAILTETESKVPEVSVTDATTLEKTEEPDALEKCNDNKPEVADSAVVSETVATPVLEEAASKMEQLDKDAEVSSTVENITNGNELNGKENGTENCQVDVDNKVTNGNENGVKNSETESQDELKVKKIDTNADSTAVSIEA